MTDYSIRHTPERKTIEATGEHPGVEEGEPLGLQIEGQTTFAFNPPTDSYTEDDLILLVENVLGGRRFEYGRDPDEPYYMVAFRSGEYSYYHVAVQGDDSITLFVQTATTEESVEEFHMLLEQVSNEEWDVEKHETDLTGSGPNVESS